VIASGWREYVFIKCEGAVSAMGELRCVGW
jgi:hypothetical protein